jgi:hypothetical protein
MFKIKSSNQIKYSILIYIIFIIIFLFIKPKICFNEDGSPKDFGVSNEQNKTIFPFWVFCILIGIFSYYIVLFISLLKNKKC